MSFRKLNTLFLIAGAVLALASCKDEEETTIAPSLDGSLDFVVEPFVTVGEVVKMTPKGPTHPKDEAIGYYWKVTPDMTKNDTTKFLNGLSADGQKSDGSFTYKFKDSLATYTVSCTGFAKGYSSKSASYYVTTVNPELDGTITGSEISSTDPKFSYFGIDYYFVEHNGLEWMRNNLANTDLGIAYVNCEAVSTIFGRYYSYEDAVKACPAGWRLPTDAEWRELAAGINGEKVADPYKTIGNIAAEFMGDVYFNLEKMWDYWPEVGEITNSSQMAMMPSGYVNLGEKVEGEYPGAAFTGLDEYAVFWTADKVEDEEGMAYFRYLVCDEPNMYSGKADTKTFGANVRCIRNH